MEYISPFVNIVKSNDKKGPNADNLPEGSEGAVNHKPVTAMITAQNNALHHSDANPFEQVVSLPLVSTGSFYAQIETLRNIYLLTKNPHMVAYHGRLLADEVRTLSRQLEGLINELDPMIKEAISSHSINAEYL